MRIQLRVFPFDIGIVFLTTNIKRPFPLTAYGNRASPVLALGHAVR